MTTTMLREVIKETRCITSSFRMITEYIWDMEIGGRVLIWGKIWTLFGGIRKTKCFSNHTLSGPRFERSISWTWVTNFTNYRKVDGVWMFWLRSL